MPFSIGQRVRTTVDATGYDAPAGTLGTILNYDAEWDDYHVLLDNPAGKKAVYGGTELTAA